MGSGGVLVWTNGRAVDDSFGSTYMSGRMSQACCLQIKGVVSCLRGSSSKRGKIDGGGTACGNSGEGGAAPSPRGATPWHGFPLGPAHEGRERPVRAVDGEVNGEK
jgi:hypothetical protein